jgi:uncharacterized membrane protein
MAIQMNRRDGRLARSLGWLSIGLGIAEVVAPRRVARLVGVRRDYDLLVRLLGAREIGTGIGILAQRRPVKPVWSRVIGDAIDLAFLGAAYASPKTDRGRLTAATAAVAGVTALDVTIARQLSRSTGVMTKTGAILVRKSITINSSPEELYRFWRDFQNLQRFMYRLESVQTTGDNRSHWVLRAPAGKKVEWDAEIIEDRPNELISWRSLPGSDVENSGSVRFERAPGGRGAVVRLEMQYRPPGGVIGAAVANLFGGAPEYQVGEDLRRFKQVIETGEVLQSDASIHRGPHPAQPMAEPPGRARTAAPGR